MYGPYGKGQGTMMKQPRKTLTIAVLAILLLSSAGGIAVAVRPAMPAMQTVNETEPNDTPGQANAFGINQTVLGTIPLSNPSDIDFFVLTTDLGREYEVTLNEQPTSGNYRLNLAIYDGNQNLITQDDTQGGGTLISWTAEDVTYYFSVDALEISVIDATYELRVVRYPEPTVSPGWDDCEINDSLTGAWSGTTPPSGPCPISVDEVVTDLNFVPYTGQFSPNPDYFVVWAKGGSDYRLETTVTPGVDTLVYLYPPGATDDSQFIASDDDGGDGRGSRIDWTPPADGNYLIKVVNLEPLPHESDETYTLTVEDVTPTPTPTHTPVASATPGTPTPSPTLRRIPGTPDAFEPNYDFERASLIGLGVKYAGLNFVPWTGTGVDNDFYKLWVIAGKLYTCETSDLGDATNTNMILYSGPSMDYGFAGNDDVQPFDSNDPYRSRITFFSSYTGYLYILLGQVGAERILPSEWANLSYSLQCYIEQPGTATPTPTSPYVPPPPQATSPPAQPTPVPPSPTPIVLVVIPMTTPVQPPPPLPAATPTPQIYIVEVVLYYDGNQNAQADPGEGIRDVLTRAYDAITGDLLSVDYTDDTGYLRFTVPSKRPVRISVPFFGFDQIVTTTNATITIRISPRS
jgi:hypothetical protein